MAKKLLVSLDLGGLELLNLRLQNLATAPANPGVGFMYYDTALGYARIYTASGWIDLGASGALDSEAVQDIVGAMVTGNTETGISVTYDDVNGVLNFAVPDASETVKGLVELATTAEATAGSDTARAVTPAGLKAGLDTKQDTSTLAATVKAYRLDEFAAPTAAVSAGSQKITNLATPTAANDAATKAYVDATAQGLDVKASVRVASTANIATLSGLLTVDGVTLVAGDRVLVKDQTTKAQNGIYVAAAGAWTRATDADAVGELSGGSFTFVEEGTSQADSGWVVTTNGSITPGTTAHDWAQFSGAGQVTAGAGLTKTGNILDVGAGTGVVVGADSIGIDPTVVARKYTQVLSTSATSYVITHGLNTQYAVVQVFLNSGTYEAVEVDVQNTSANTVTLGFAVAPAANAYAVVVLG